MEVSDDARSGGGGGGLSSEGVKVEGIVPICPRVGTSRPQTGPTPRALSHSGEQVAYAVCASGLAVCRVGIWTRGVD